MRRRNLDSVTIPPSSSPLKLLGRHDLAKLFDVSVWTIWDWQRKGIIPKPFQITPGSPHRWREIDLILWLKKQNRKTVKAYNEADESDVA